MLSTGSFEQTTPNIRAATAKLLAYQTANYDFIAIQHIDKEVVNYLNVYYILWLFHNTILESKNCLIWFTNCINDLILMTYLCFLPQQ